MKHSTARSVGASTRFLRGGAGAGLAASLMLATLLPLQEAAAGTKYTDTACEGQELSFHVQRPRQDIDYDGKTSYKLRIKGGSATEGQDYRTPDRELTFNGKSTEWIEVKTLEDHTAENDETVRLELYAPDTGSVWIQRNGLWVQPESLMPQTISFRGTIRDWANAERQGAWKRAGTVWYDC